MNNVDAAKERPVGSLRLAAMSIVLANEPS